MLKSSTRCQKHKLCPSSIRSQLHKPSAYPGQGFNATASLFVSMSGVCTKSKPSNSGHSGQLFLSTATRERHCFTNKSGQQLNLWCQPVAMHVQLHPGYCKRYSDITDRNFPENHPGFRMCLCPMSQRGQPWVRVSGQPWVRVSVSSQPLHWGRKYSLLPPTPNWMAWRQSGRRECEEAGLFLFLFLFLLFVWFLFLFLFLLYVWFLFTS